MQVERGTQQDTYSGWKNYATWNVVAWLDNEYILYSAAQGYKTYPQPYLSLRQDLRAAFGFTKTKDGVSLWDTSLDIEALNNLVAGVPNCPK